MRGFYGFIRFCLSSCYQFYVRSDSEKFIKYLRKKGLQIGDDVKFYEPSTNVVDLTRPYMISIGNKVKITRGVVILTHGFDWSVLRECYKRPFGSAGRVDIGDNVFIGINSIILKGVTVGDNVIIAAGSIVTRDVPSDSVIAGNPAKLICSIEDLKEKYLQREKTEAAEVARSIIQQEGRYPSPQDFKEFFFLYLERNRLAFNGLPVETQVGDYMMEFLSSSPDFESFQAFLEYAQVSSPSDKNNIEH